MTMTSKLHPSIRNHTSRALAALLSITAATSVFAEDDILAMAKDFVAKASAKSTEWTGPTTGPKAQSDKTIVYVSSDQRNSGVTGVADGAKEAAKVIGWNFRAIDGRGSVEGRGQALSQAIFSPAPSMASTFTPRTARVSAGFACRKRSPMSPSGVQTRTGYSSRRRSPSTRLHSIPAEYKKP
jgi:hypothetical protein